MAAALDPSLDGDQLRQVRRLRFDPPLETAFSDQHTTSTLGRVRIVFGILVVFGILGLMRPPNPNDSGAALIDYVFTAMYGVLFGLALSYRFRHLAAPGLAASSVLSQIAFGLTAKNLDVALGIVINVMYGIVIISALQVRFRVALAFGVSMLIARAWTLTYRGMWGNEAAMFFVFMVAEFTFLCVGSYLSEVRDRKSFLFQQQLKVEQARTHALVQNVLPPTIADELSKHPGTLARFHESATVMFADIVGFTPFAESHSPNEVVGMLNDLFSRFDALIKDTAVVKLKTVGDAYMLAGGVPDPDPCHAANVANAALELRGAANAAGIAMRIGIHTGPLIAGVLGTERLMYDVWGPTVNLAARLESSAEAGQILVSQAVRNALADTHDFQDLGERDLKGLGPTATYALLRRKIAGIELKAPHNG